MMMSDNESQATIPSDLEDDGGPEDQNITLIRLVKQKEFLYIKSDRRYSDRNLTERTWTQIATQIGWTIFFYKILPKITEINVY